MSELSVGPLFVVGPSRSGTELMRTALNRHPRIGIAAETHYFDDLRPRLHGGRQPLTAGEMVAAATQFEAIRRFTYSLHERPDVEPDPALMARGSRLGGTADALFEAHCAGLAGATGADIWGEKTPRHLFRATEILAAFPAARILVMVRDPRAVAVSYRDWTNRWFTDREIDAALAASLGRERTRVRHSYSLTLIALLWASAATTARRLAARHPHAVRIVRFEDLLSAPEPTLRGVADWLGLSFEPAMMTVAVVNSSYLDAGARSGFDPTIAGHWIERLSADEAGYVDWLTARAAAPFGYPRSPHGPGLVFLAGELVRAPWRLLRAGLANRGRIGSLGPYLWARARGLVGGAT